jgi:serine/threonine protein kinase
MWSIGCIFAQILQRKTILQGDNAKNQLELIFEMIGSPSKEDVAQVESEKWKDWLRKLKKRPPSNLKEYFPKASDKALDLLQKLLVFNPNKRINIDDALLHPYLEGLHIEDDEPSRQPISPLEFEFEKHRLNGHQLKGNRPTLTPDLIYEEILLYHFQERLNWHNQMIKTGKGTLYGVLNSEHASNIYDDNEGDYDEFGL